MKWELQKRKINDLHLYTKNPRKLTKHNADQLHESISKFGQCEPIVINSDNTVIGGHQRLRTMRKMGYKEVDVYVPDQPLSEREIEELNIRLNRNNGDWDWDILGNVWDPNDLIEWGFTLEELHLDEIPEKSTSEDPDEGKKKCKMTITFQHVDHIQEAENKISSIVDSYEGAYYKVKL
jgi:hypothetical protein